MLIKLLVYDSPDAIQGGMPQIYGPAAVADGAKRYNTAGMVHVCTSPPSIDIEAEPANVLLAQPTLTMQRQ